MKIVQVLLLLPNFNVRFEFREMNMRDVEKEISKINTKKAVASSSNPAKVFQEISDSCSSVLQKIWNDKIEQNCQFSENLKLADIFEKFDKNFAKNYNPVGVLPTLAKVFEKFMEKKVVNHVNTLQIFALLQKIFPYTQYDLFYHQKGGRRPLITKVLGGEYWWMFLRHFAVLNMNF